MARMFKVPQFNYPGGKVRLRKWLVSMMPREGGRYVEPFAGRGNVFWLAACCLKFQEWWLNDIYTKPFFDAIRDVDVVDIPIKLTVEDVRAHIKARSI
ncbi:MAG TPA: DNA adenine methylase, partial [Planctomycetota bacterium]|nr:DNA adenine methylase [Planctomycetota bacterium]